MASVQEPVANKKSGDGTKELVILTGILVTVMVGAVVTFWVGSRALDRQSGTPAVTAAVTTAPAEAQPRPRAVASAPTDLEVFHADVYFDSKSTRLRADAVRVLQEKATLMDRSSTWIVLVQGHADRYGTPEYNRLLAQRRAEEVKQFLVELGVLETSVKVVAVGQDGSVCDGPNRECQKLNRRVHLEIRKLPAAAVAVPVQPVVVDKDSVDTTVPSVVSPATDR